VSTKTNFVTNMDDVAMEKQVFWSPILAGVVLALGSEVLLNFLGLGLGLTSLNQSAQAMSKVGTGTVIWLSLSGILTMFYGGWACGKFLNIKCKMFIAMHGVLAWSIATLITVAVSTTTLGMVIGGPNNIAKYSIAQMGQHSFNLADSNQTTTPTPEPASTPPTEGTEEQTSTAAGEASYSLFFAFLLSAIASASGAVMARKQE
jgi:hypothetical protein